MVNIYSLSDWKKKKHVIMNSLPILEDKHVLGSMLHTNSVHSTFTDYYEYGLAKYRDVVLACVNDELNQFYETVNGKFFVQHMWFETSFKLQHHPPHDHGDKGYSCVLYVNFDKTVHTPTKFHIDNGYLPDVNEGDLVIFPSDLVHEALQNESNIPRTIISFNLERL